MAIELQCKLSQPFDYSTARTDDWTPPATTITVPPDLIAPSELGSTMEYVLPTTILLGGGGKSPPAFHIISALLRARECERILLSSEGAESGILALLAWSNT